MDPENYLQHLRNEGHLREGALCLTEMTLKRFHSFLDNESVIDLGVVDTDLLHRYAETLSIMSPCSVRHHLSIISQYLKYRAPSAMAISGDSMPSRAVMCFPSLPRLHPPAVYIPSFDDIGRLIRTANSHERTQPVGDLAYIVTSTGFRMGELENLRVTDIVAGLVRIESKYFPVTRYLPLSPRAIQSLASLHARFPASDLVFGDRSRAYLQGLAARLRSLAGKIGTEDIRLYSLRRAVLEHFRCLVKTDHEERVIQYVIGLGNSALDSSESKLDVETNLETAKRLFADLWAELDKRHV